MPISPRATVIIIWWILEAYNFSAKLLAAINNFCIVCGREVKRLLEISTELFEIFLSLKSILVPDILVAMVTTKPETLIDPLEIYKALGFRDR